MGGARSRFEGRLAVQGGEGWIGGVEDTGGGDDEWEWWWRSGRRAEDVELVGGGVESCRRRGFRIGGFGGWVG